MSIQACTKQATILMYVHSHLYLSIYLPIYIYIYIYIYTHTHTYTNSQAHIGPVGSGCRIHQLHLCRSIPPHHKHTHTHTHTHNKCPGYDTKQSDSEASVMLELWGKRSIPSLLLLSDPLWPGVVAPDRDPSMGQRELFDIQTVY